MVLTEEVEKAGAFVRKERASLTSRGGDGNGGTVFRLASDGAFLALHSFTGGSDGCFPIAGLSADTEGNIYGTTEAGGDGGACSLGGGHGTIYTICCHGYKVLQTLCRHRVCKHGAYPQAAVISDKKGNLYGTTSGGGSTNCQELGCGTVFEFRN